MQSLAYLHHSSPVPGAALYADGDVRPAAPPRPSRPKPARRQAPLSPASARGPPDLTRSNAGAAPPPVSSPPQLVLRQKNAILDMSMKRAYTKGARAGPGGGRAWPAAERFSLPRRTARLS